jgi:hypothetical protein
MEMDVLAESDCGRVVAVEVKKTKAPAGASDVQDFIEKVDVYATLNSGNKILPAFFCAGWYGGEVGIVLKSFKNETPRRYSKRNHRRSVAAALDHGLETIRLAGAEILGRICPAAKEETPKLIQTLSNNAPKTWTSAAAPLTNVNTKWREDPAVANAIPALVEDLAADDWRKRAAARGSFGGQRQKHPAHGQGCPEKDRPQMAPNQSGPEPNPRTHEIPGRKPVARPGRRRGGPGHLRFLRR